MQVWLHLYYLGGLKPQSSAVILVLALQNQVEQRACEAFLCKRD